MPGPEIMAGGLLLVWSNFVRWRGGGGGLASGEMFSPLIRAVPAFLV